MARIDQEQKHQEQKNKFLMKAQALFAEKGYGSTSMADIAVACEVQKATLYHYFESKEALLFGILECHSRQKKEDENFCRLFCGATLEERFYQVAKHHLEEMDRQESLEFMKILLVETTTSGRMKEYYQKYLRERMEEFTEGVIAPLRKGKMSDLEMRRLAHQFFACLMHYSWQTRMVGRIDEFVGPEDEYIRRLARLFGREGA